MRYHELFENIVDSPGFKSWFAGSKVVKDGKPQLMFHGTNKAFQEFHLGSHFGTVRAANHRLAFLRGERKRLGSKDEVENQHIIPVYLSIKNPLRVTDIDAGDEATLLNSIARGKYPGLDVHVGRREGAYAAAEHAGYDGLVYRNNIEDRGKYSWVVFHPSQVRSALVDRAETVSELAAPTITSASGPNGINRKAADRMLDPKGYFKPKWPTKAITEATVRLTDLYDEHELNDQSEQLYSYVDDDDLQKDFVIHEMTPAQAKTYVTARDDMTVYASFRKFATKAQKQLVRDKLKQYDANRIIVVINKTVLDGNHQLIAGIMANQPIKYIDLAN